MTELDNIKHHNVKPQAMKKVTNMNCHYEIKERPEQ